MKVRVLFVFFDELFMLKIIGLAQVSSIPKMWCLEFKCSTVCAKKKSRKLHLVASYILKRMRSNIT